jgi:hypothetical protein
MRSANCRSFEDQFPGIPGFFFLLPPTAVSRYQVFGDCPASRMIVLI